MYREEGKVKVRDWLLRMKLKDLVTGDAGAHAPFPACSALIVQRLESPVRPSTFTAAVAPLGRVTTEQIFGVNEVKSTGKVDVAFAVKVLIYPNGTFVGV